MSFSKKIGIEGDLMQETMQKREYGKISQFLQKKLPTLPQRILVAVAVTFLPIIILAIAICGISLFRQQL